MKCKRFLTTFKYMGLSAMILNGSLIIAEAKKNDDSCHHRHHHSERTKCHRDKHCCKGDQGDPGDPGAPGQRGKKGEKGDRGRRGRPGSNATLPVLAYGMSLIPGDAAETVCPGNVAPFPGNVVPYPVDVLFNGLDDVPAGSGQFVIPNTGVYLVITGFGATDCTSTVPPFCPRIFHYNLNGNLILPGGVLDLNDPSTNINPFAFAFAAQAGDVFTVTYEGDGTSTGCIILGTTGAPNANAACIILQQQFPPYILTP